VFDSADDSAGTCHLGTFTCDKASSNEKRLKSMEFEHTISD
jgi:hypothetical protein